MSSPTLAIDFGTSNSAAAIMTDHGVRRIPMEANAETLPTAVFFPTEGGAMLVGSAAGDALIEGDDGRYMRALKSILGTSLFHESRLLGGKRRTMADIVTAFLAELKQRAEAQLGQPIDKVLSGRPVRFHSKNLAQDTQAQEDLHQCYLAAGFSDVSFMLEPEAAAVANHADGNGNAVGLIVDIGGGTSDFSVFRSSHDKIDILASHGIRLGGTDFDQAVSVTHSMPLLGHGGRLRRSFGDGELPVPTGIYVDLSTWAKIPFLYARDTQRLVEDLVLHAIDDTAMQRLSTTINDQLGHDLAFAVEHGKIAANGPNESAKIDMTFIERGLSAPITTGTMNAALSGFRAQLKTAIFDTLIKAQVTPAEIDTLVMVGGSSLMAMIADEAQSICPTARLMRSEAFTAVVDGLAIATRNTG